MFGKEQRALWFEKRRRQVRLDESEMLQGAGTAHKMCAMAVGARKATSRLRQRMRIRIVFIALVGCLVGWVGGWLTR